MASIPTDLIAVQPDPLPRWVSMWEGARTHAFQWFCGGYGSGKTTFGVFEAFVNSIVRHPGMTGIVVAPSYPLLWQTWFREWEFWFKPFTGLYTVHKGGPEGAHLTFSNGSEVLMRSTSNPASLEGPNVAWVVFDEASRETKIDSYNVLTARIRRPYPGRMGNVLISGPPASRAHWTAEEFGYAAGPRTLNGKTVTFDGDAFQWSSGDHMLVRSRTRDNPRLPEGYERKLRNRPGATGKWCEQYLDAEFGSIEGAVWPQFKRDKHVVPASVLAGRKWRRVVAGVDWGWAHPGVIIVIGIDYDDNVYVLDEEVHERMVYADGADDWGPVFRALHKRTGFTEVHYDPSGPGNAAVVGRVLRSVRMYPADNEVGEGIRRVAARFEACGGSIGERAIVTDPDTGESRETEQPGIWISDKCVKLIDRIEGYERKRVKGVYQEAPSEVNDDECDGLRYAVMSIGDVR